MRNTCITKRVNPRGRKTPNNNIIRVSQRRQTAYTSQHDLAYRNKFPASNLEKGWIIDSGASAHMTPFKRDCKNVRPTYKLIYLADGSTVLCKTMGDIHIPISQDKTKIGTLILEDVLIVPNLDRRLFSVHAFLSKGHNWVHFSQQTIQLGIKDGPSIDLPVTSLQSNAFVVDHNTTHTKSKDTVFDINKQRVSTDILHS